MHFNRVLSCKTSIELQNVKSIAYLSLSFFFCFCLYLFLCLCLFLSVSFYQSLFYSIWPFLTLNSLSLSLCVRLSHSLILRRSLPLFLYVSFSLSLTLYLPVTLSLSLSLSVSQELKRARNANIWSQNSWRLAWLVDLQRIERTTNFPQFFILPLQHEKQARLSCSTTTVAIEKFR